MRTQPSLERVSEEKKGEQKADLNVKDARKTQRNDLRKRERVNENER